MKLGFKPFFQCEA